VVGAGISGLLAAYFYRQAQTADIRILILDNHDDFGGHARRTQFTHDDDTRISNAGTFWIEGRYAGVPKRLLSELGIIVPRPDSNRQCSTLVDISASAA